MILASEPSRRYMYKAEDLRLSDITDVLIGYLELTYSDNLPYKNNFSERDILIKYGQVSVVRRLKEIRRQLEEN